MKDTNRPVIYPKCKCEEGQEADWEHSNETCIDIRPIIRKSIGIILLILGTICFYDAISTIIFIEDESFFWGTLIAAFIFTFLAYYVLRVCPIKEVTIRCRNCDFKTTINFKGK
jgi:hypothetical protein